MVHRRVTQVTNEDWDTLANYWTISCVDWRKRTAASTATDLDIFFVVRGRRKVRRLWSTEKRPKHDYENIFFTTSANERSKDTSPAKRRMKTNLYWRGQEKKKKKRRKSVSTTTRVSWTIRIWDLTKLHVHNFVTVAVMIYRSTTATVASTGENDRDGRKTGAREDKKRTPRLAFRARQCTHQSFRRSAADECIDFFCFIVPSGNVAVATLPTAARARRRQRKSNNARHF